MVTWRRVLTLGSAALLVSSAALFAQNQQTRKLNDAEKKEVQAILKIVEGVSAGQAAPNDLSLAWLHEDLMKAQSNKQYLPFSVTIDPTKVASGKVSLYWRVVEKNPPAPADAKKDEKKSAKVDYPYEDMGTVAITPGQSTPLRLSRSFTVGPGAYEVLVVAREFVEKPAKNAPAPKISVLRQAVTVPDLWTTELNTSSVIIAERIDPLPAPLTPQQQIERPYALGTMEIMPAFTSKFTKKSEISTFMLIYNVQTDSANKPDVSVEYNFYTKQAGAEKFFNKTSPQNLNAQTLPPQFDLAAGHQLQTGQAVPLASFPEGDYRLEIKITDKIANKSLTRDITFSVSGS